MYSPLCSPRLRSQCGKFAQTVRRAGAGAESGAGAETSGAGVGAETPGRDATYKGVSYGNRILARVVEAPSLFLEPFYGALSVVTRRDSFIFRILVLLNSVSAN